MAAAFALAGCGVSDLRIGSVTADNLRAGPHTAAYTSGKPVDVVAGCIGERWHGKHAKTASLKTSQGYSVQIGDHGAAVVVADVAPEQSGSRVRIAAADAARLGTLSAEVASCI